MIRPKRLNTATQKSRPRGRSSKKAGPRKLLPVLRPCQNMRDIIKQMALLEDHMYHPQKRCPDCIRKHFLTIEGLAEECSTLCNPKNILPESRSIATKIRVLHHAWEARPKDARVTEYIAGRLRKLRKCLMRSFSALPVDKLPTKETNAVNTVLRRAQGTYKTRKTRKSTPQARVRRVRRRRAGLARRLASTA